MKVLLTGASGFVGSHLGEALVGRGYAVKALVRRSSDTELLEKLGVEIVHGDITDLPAVTSAARNCQYVYHLAAKRARHRASKEQYRAINVQGTDNVARAALKAGVERLVYGSGTGIYGYIKNSPVDENTALKPDSYYHESKALGENVVLHYHKHEGLPVVIARLGNLIGPRSFDFLNVCRALSTKRFRIIGGGQNYAHLGYISDVVDGLQCCCEIEAVEGKTYLITGGEPVTAAALIKMTALELGINRQFATMPAEPFHAFKSVAEGVYRYFGFELPYAHRYNLFLVDKIFDISKARNDLAYEPKVSVQEAVQRTIKWYRDNGYL